MFVGFEVIVGCSLGVEYLNGDWVDDPFNYVVVDLLTIRLTFSWDRE